MFFNGMVELKKLNAKKVDVYVGIFIQPTMPHAYLLFYNCRYGTWVEDFQFDRCLLYFLG
jgi:hypothetical protein